MTSSNPFFARLRLRSSPRDGCLARTPVRGLLLYRIAALLAPQGTLGWARIEGGRGRDFSILFDARGGSDFGSGNWEPRVQQVLKRWLAPGKLFYDVGANAGYLCLVAAVTLAIFIGGYGLLFRRDMARMLKQLAQLREAGGDDRVGGLAG